MDDVLSPDSPGTPGTPLEDSSRESSADIQGQGDYENDPGQPNDVGRSAEGLSDTGLSPLRDSPSPAPDTSRELEPDDDDTNVRGEAKYE